jgi:hypothetical protein
MSETSDLTDIENDVVLRCTPGREGDHLTFDYSVTNEGAVATYVMDALPSVDKMTGRLSLEPDAVSVWLGLDGMLRISKGMPPMPDDTKAEDRIVPLALKLDPGESIKRRLLEPMPLAEHSPIAPYGNLREYRPKPILGVTLLIEHIRADMAGFIAVQAAGYPKPFMRLVPTGDALPMHRLACPLRTRNLQVFTRIDAYPRPL